MAQPPRSCRGGRVPSEPWPRPVATLLVAVLGRDVLVMGGRARGVGRDVRVDLPGRPLDGADDQTLELRVGPDVLAVAHRGVEDAALAVHARPGLGVVRPLVIVAP